MRCLIVTDREEGIDDNDLGADEEKGNESSKSRKISRRQLLAGSVLTVVGISGGFLGANAVMDYRSNKDSLSFLKSISSKKGALTAINTEKVVYKGQNVKNASTKQFALGSGGNHPESAVFSFSNGKESEDKKQVDIYISFDNMFSRDFILMNQRLFTDLLENGYIDLNIHPVATGTIMSMFSPNILCETFVTKGSDPWNTMIGLLKLSAEIKTGKNREEIATAISKRVEETSRIKFDNNLIYSGEFASWILQVGNDKNLQGEGKSLPLLYVNGNMINLNNINTNDSEEVRRAIVKAV